MLDCRWNAVWAEAAGERYEKTAGGDKLLEKLSLKPSFIFKPALTWAKEPKNQNWFWAFDQAQAGFEKIYSKRGTAWLQGVDKAWNQARVKDGAPLIVKLAQHKLLIHWQGVLHEIIEVGL